MSGDGRVRTGVLISGRGSNLQSLLNAARDPAYPARIELVISNQPEAYGLERARRAGVAAMAVDHRAFPSREAFEAEITAALEQAQVQLVVMAGFMRIVTAGFVAQWRDRLINIHPALLPSFPGLDTHARALAEGVKLHGCTVHFVRSEVDAGPIIGQAAVPVLSDDDEARLAARVLAAEHALLPRALALVASGRARISGARVAISAGEADTEARLVNPETCKPRRPSAN
jgi:phosphoribosylglycinamide formyltransferase-1